MTQQAPTLITSGEAALILRVSQRTVVRWTDDPDKPLTAVFRYPGPKGARLYDMATVIELARQLGLKPPSVAQLDLGLPEGTHAP